MRALSELRLSHGYQFAVRAFGSAWFFVLAILTLVAMFRTLHSTGVARLEMHVWADLMSKSFIAAYYLMVWALMLLRPVPIAQSDGVCHRPWRSPGPICR